MVSTLWCLAFRSPNATLLRPGTVTATTVASVSKFTGSTTTSILSYHADASPHTKKSFPVSVVGYQGGRSASLVTGFSDAAHVRELRASEEGWHVVKIKRPQPRTTLQSDSDAH
jgi:hypothetical protein